MSYDIVYAPVAIRDLQRIWAEVLEASQSNDVTAKYIDDLMEKVAEKRDFPRSGSPLLYENGFIGYHFVVFKSYMAFYRIEDTRMLVDRVLYRKSDYMRTIFRSCGP